MPARVPVLRTSPNQLVPNMAQADQNALATMKGRQQVADYPEDRNYLRQQRQFQTQQQERTIQQQPVMDARAGQLFLMKVAPTLQLEQYLSGGREMLINQHGLNPDSLPDEALLNKAAQANGWDLQQSFKAWQDKISGRTEEAEPDQRKFTTWMTPQGKPVNIRVGEEPPAGSVPFKGKGLDIQFGEDGRPISITQGGTGGSGGAQEITRKNTTKLQEKFFNAANKLSRVQEIRSRYKKEFLEIGPRGLTVWTGIKEKFGGDPPQAEKDKLTEATAFYRNSISNTNKHIKETTGAQMSEREAGRLMLEVPSAGQSWFDFIWNGDSATQYESKMDDIELTLRASMARTKWYLSKGMTYPEIANLMDKDTGKDLEPIKAAIKARGKGQ